MTRVALGLVLACLTGVGVLPQTDEGARLVVSPPPIVWIEAGTFVMGADERDVDFAVRLCERSSSLASESLAPGMGGECARRRFAMEMPRRRVWTAAYGMDRTEVTQRRWRGCVIAGRCSPSRIRGQGRLAGPRLPVVDVTFDEARRYCEFTGGRLPSDPEWERAARGGGRHRFPWGRQYNPRLANHGRSPRGPDGEDGWALAAPVGSFPGGASLRGLLDMAGNVWEWTASAPGAHEVGPGADPDVYRVIRGGSWAQPPVALRVTHRAWQPRRAHRGDLGLRCAHDLPPLAARHSSAILRRP